MSTPAQTNQIKFQVASVGYDTPSPEFLQIPEPIAIMSDRQELVALLGSAHDPASLADYHP